ncbi:hypothetical protein GCM10029992_54250 [Glycomyces albus]
MNELRAAFADTEAVAAVVVAERDRDLTSEDLAYLEAAAADIADLGYTIDPAPAPTPPKTVWPPRWSPSSTPAPTPTPRSRRSAPYSTPTGPRGSPS